MFLESIGALRRLQRAAEKAVRRAVVWAPLLAAVLGGAPSARAGSSAILNINVSIQGITPISDLTAVPGSSSGTVSLSWTEPFHAAGLAPFSYDVRASTLAQISSDAAFSVAMPLSAFSTSVPPSPGPGGGGVGFIVGSLTPNVTYYFAVRENDSSSLHGFWSRSASPARNLNNFAVPLAGAPPPPSGGSVQSVYLSSMAVSWNGSLGATSYLLVASTQSANPPLLIAASTATSSTSALLTGFAPNATYFFYVSACAIGCSSYAAIGSSITLAEPAASLTATAVSSGTVSLAWSANGDPAGTEYEVRQSTDGLSYLRVHASTQTTAVVGGLSGLSTYYYQVVAYNGAGIPASPSAPLQILTLIGPPGPSSGGGASAVFVSSLTASWGATPGATDYLLVASTASALPPDLIAASSASVANVGTLLGLAPNTTYFLSVSACAGGCSPFVGLGSTMTLAAPVAGLTATAVSSSVVSLSWSLSGNPAGTVFAVQKSSDGSNFGTIAIGTTTFGTASRLSGGGTYYFAIVAINGAGIQTPAAGAAQVVTPVGPVPSVPTGLTAASGLLSAFVSWNALPDAQQGAGLLYYELERSSRPAAGFVLIATTTATSFLDKPLAAGATQYYRIRARDIGLTDGAASLAAAALPFTQLPMEPIGVQVQPSSSSVKISWSPTRKFFDGTPFLSTATPTADELMGYSVFRSTSICDAPFLQISTLTINTNTLTDGTNGDNYYYRLFSFNTAGVSTNVVTLSALGEYSYLIDDCVSRVVLDASNAAALRGSANGVGDVRITPIKRPQDVGNGVFQSLEWRADQNGTELKSFTLPKPARVVLHFETANGVVVPSGSSARGSSPRASSSAKPSDLGAYWYNGAQFQKMYGQVDLVDQVVNVDSPNLGVYQIRALARSAGVVFDVSNLSSRVITPNGDGRNDVVIFTYDPGPENVVPEGRIFDLQGALVTEMTPGLVPNTLTWNGRMNGLPVHSGVYVYRITGGGKTFTGTVVVAR